MISKNPSPGSHMMTGTIKIFMAEALMLPTGFITAIFLARSLGPVGYGMFALVSRLIIWMEWICIRGLSGTTIKFIGEAPDWRSVASTAIKLYIFIGFGIAVLLWLFAPLLSSLFGEPDIIGYIRLFAVEIPVLALASACSHILIGTARYRDAARIRALRYMARLILIILFVEMGLSVKGAILGTIGASLLELIITWHYTRPALFIKPAFPLRRLLGFGAPLFMSELCQRVFRMELFVLKALGGTAAQVGFYGAAMNLTVPPVLFSRALSSPLLSTLSSLLGNGDNDKAREIAGASLRSVIWLMPLVAMVAGSSEEIVIFIFGDKYVHAGPVLSLLILSTIGILAIKISKTILTALGKPGMTFIVAGPMVLIALAGHLVLIPLMGGTGAAIVTASVATLGALLSLIIIYREWNLSLPLKSVLKGLACSAVAYSIAILWPAAGLVLILKIILIILIVILFFRITGEFSTDEIGLLRSMIPRRFS